MNTVGMFGKYLRKEHGFWRIQSDDKEICYCKHSPKYGGIYAYIEPGNSGVKLVANGLNQHFDDFNKLGDFLARLEENGEKNHNSLVNTLYRVTRSRSMRTFAL